MSVFGKVVGWLEGAAHTVSDLAKKVFGAIHTVWTFLVNIGSLLTSAWDWMVNGVTWFTSQVSDWAAAVYTTLWHTVTNLIPEAAAWAFRQAVKWAGSALHTVSSFLHGLIHTLAQWVKHELKTLAHTAKAWVDAVIHFVTAPIKWIYNVAKGAINLVLHPEALANYLVGHLIVPLVKWFLRAGSDVIVWFIKLVIRDGAGIAHLLEDVIEKVV